MIVDYYTLRSSKQTKKILYQDEYFYAGNTASLYEEIISGLINILILNINIITVFISKRQNSSNIDYDDHVAYFVTVHCSNQQAINVS